MKNNILHRSIFHLFLIAFLSLIAYSNTFESSFHFDDKHYIVENPAIKNLRNFVQPSSSVDFSREFQYKTFSRRYLGYLSFALNYRLHGLDVTGYHIVNLLVHICTSLLVYFFILLTFKTPFLGNSAIRDYARHIALFTALLFACHPLQTEAVTYIWQRVTSICTMFYLLSLVAYIKWRLLLQSEESIKQGFKVNGKESIFPSPGHPMLYLLSLASAILAMKTKEIAFMLPVMLTLYEMIFFEGKNKKRILYLIPFIITMLIIPLTTISGEPIGNLDNLLKGGTQLSRVEYLLAQFRVLVTYLRLIFLPVNQNLDYDYPRYYYFFNIEVFTSCVFLALIFGLSIFMLSRYRDSAPHTRLISFGIIWFFVNLLLESSIIPLNNVIFEHRMYLPSVGVFSALTTAIFMVINRWRVYARVIMVMLAVIIMVLTVASYARNTVWKDEPTLWRDVVNKSPSKARGYNSLGLYYESQGLIDKAIQQYLLAIKLNPDYPNAHNNLGVAYMSQGLIDKAIEHCLLAIKLNPNYPDPYNNLGNAYESLNLLDMAMKQYQNAIKLVPNDPITHYNLGRIYQLKGSVNRAIEQYLLAIKLKPDYPKAHHNLGVAYKSQGDTEQAIKAYKNALMLKPGWELPRKELKQINKEL
jgi:tetratricopeptide (TPR) repeat protein